MNRLKDRGERDDADAPRSRGQAFLSKREILTVSPDAQLPHTREIFIPGTCSSPDIDE